MFHLLIAAENGDLDAYKPLLEMIEDKNPSDRFGITPMDIADCLNHEKICKLIEDVNGENKSAFLPRQSKHHILNNKAIKSLEGLMNSKREEKRVGIHSGLSYYTKKVYLRQKKLHAVKKKPIPKSYCHCTAM